jgi:hypothetical protein
LTVLPFNQEVNNNEEIVMRTDYPLHTGARSTLGLFSAALIVWIGFAVVEILIDMIQRAFLTPSVGVSSAQLTGALLFAFIVIATTWYYLSRLSVLPSRTQLVGIGAFWVMMTLAFEVVSRSFMSERYVMRLLVEVLVGDYNVFGGRFWMLVLAVQLMGPIFVGSLHSLSHRRSARMTSSF